MHTTVVTRIPDITPDEHDHPLKVLTLNPPWGWLLAYGLKKWETRSWQPSYRGLIAIHISSGLGDLGSLTTLRRLCKTEPFKAAFQSIGHDNPVATLPRGKIIAVGVVRNVERTEAIKHLLSEQELAFGDYAPGRYAWRFDAVNRLRVQIAARGQLGIWNWTPYADPDITQHASHRV